MIFGGVHRKFEQSNLYLESLAQCCKTAVISRTLIYFKLPAMDFSQLIQIAAVANAASSSHPTPPTGANRRTAGASRSKISVSVKSDLPGREVAW